MYLEKYEALSDSKHETYEFLSSGTKGTIKKIVYYQKIQYGLYNLAFGDWDEDAKKIKDDVRSNNEDRDKILATVAATTIDFINYHKNAIVFATGITPAKTRLYQIGIKYILA